MRTNAFNRIGVGLVILLMLIPIMASADVFMKQKHHQDGFTMMGKTEPPKDYVGTMWITADKARNDMDDKSVIVRLDKNVMVILDHTKKKYMEVPLNFAEAAQKEAEKQGPSDEEMAKLPAAMRNLMKGAMQMNITVTETSEKKVINGWNCRKYVQKIEGGMAPSESEVWASQDVKLDEKLLSKFNAAFMAMQPGLKESLGDIQKQMEKIKGVAVLTIATSTIMKTQMKSSVELLEVKDDASAPTGTFEIPAGYKKGSFGRE
jgi:hypothetical protein